MKIAYNPLGSAVLTVAPPENDITFDIPGKAIWAKGTKFGWYTTFVKDTSASGGGYSGLVPIPNYNSGSTTRFLREDGTWVIPTNTTYNVVSNSNNGLAPKVINTNTATVGNGYYVLASTNGSTTPSWYKLPATAYYYRPIKVDSEEILGSNNNALNLIPGANINISNSDGNVTISSPNSTTVNLAIPYIVGPSTDTKGVWTGIHSGITEYTDGLTIIYVPGVAGNSTTTLNINGLGAKTCYYTNTSLLTSHFSTGTPIILTYSGGGWKRADYDSWTPYVAAYCSTAASTAAKTATCNSYTLTEKTYLHVLIAYSNTSATALTFNVNSKGAKPIYINGLASSSTNYTLPAGTYIVYYDGTNYYFRTNGVLPGTIEKANAVSNNLILKIKTGTTEGTDLYTYNGSSAKTLDIKAGSNISLTAASGSLTISSTNTTYSVFTGATSSADGTTGLVKQPLKADIGKFLKGDGTWSALNTSNVIALTSYSKATTAGDLSTSDSLNTALGKLEYKADYAYDFIVATMSETDDSNTTIDRLKEVFDVLSGITETDTIKNLVGKYLPLTGGTLKNGTERSPLILDTTATTEVGLRLAMSGTVKSWIGYSATYGTYLYNSTRQKYLNYKDDGNLLFEGNTVYHSGNLTKSTLGLGNVQNTAFYLRVTTVNGAAWNMAGTTNGAAFTIYAPTTAGTDGLILKSNGSGAPSWVNTSALNVASAQNGIFYIEGTGTTAGTWLGLHSGISDYYAGLTIAYKVPIAGASTTTLNINSKGAKTCKVNNSNLTTHYAAGCVILLVYDGTYFRVSDYSRTEVRQYLTETDTEYPLLFRYNTAAPTSNGYVTDYTRYDSKITINPKIGKITTPVIQTTKLINENGNLYTEEFIEGTHTTSTGAWTGVSKDESLYDGKIILYWIPNYKWEAVTLNLTLSNGTTTGAKNVYYGGTTRLTGYYTSNNVIRMVYRESVNISGTTYSGWWCEANYDANTVPAAYCETAAATADKGATMSGYFVSGPHYVHVTLYYTNTAAKALRLSINSLSYYPIYINGAASSSSNYNLPRGSYLVYFDGANYHFRTDGKIPMAGGDVVSYGIHGQTINMALDTTWKDTGIYFKTGDKIYDGQGSYLILISTSTGIWTGYFALRWLTGTTSNTTVISDEIILQGGDASTYQRPYLRTYTDHTNNRVKLLISHSESITAKDWVIKFKRLM